MQLLYVSLLIGTICFSFLKVKRSNIVLLLLIAVSTLIAALRPETMRDYVEYSAFFLGKENLKFEVGFRWFVRYLNNITYNPIFFFALFALISIGTRLLFIYKYASFFFVSFEVYISNVYILHDMIQIRIAIASSILLWSTIYIYNRNFKKFIFIVSIAFIFHYAALAILPLYFLQKGRVNIWMYILIPISYLCYSIGIQLGNITQYLQLDFIQNLYNLYSQSAILKDEQINVYNNLQLLRCAIYYCILHYVNLILQYNKYVLLYLKVYVISLSTLVFFSDIPTLAFRISELYQTIEIILFPLLIYVFKNKAIGSMVVILILSIIAYINIFHIGLLN